MVQRECNPGRQTDMKFVLGMLILLTLSVLNTQAQGLGERCEDKCSDPDAECKESRSSGIYSCVCKNTSTDQRCEASQDEKACGEVSSDQTCPGGYECTEEIRGSHKTCQLPHAANSCGRQPAA